MAKLHKSVIDAMWVGKSTESCQSQRYLSVLPKAAEEKIIVSCTNLYDQFFVSSGERMVKVIAACFSYFEGDYWPDVLEEIIYLAQQEDERKSGMKRTEIVDEGSLKDSDHSNHSCNVLKDLLMQKLGETISSERKDFIMVHFQHACTHCCKIIESEERWVCKQCMQFQLCRKLKWTMCLRLVRIKMRL